MSRFYAIPGIIATSTMTLKSNAVTETGDEVNDEDDDDDKKTMNDKSTRRKQRKGE